MPDLRKPGVTASISEGPLRAVLKLILVAAIVTAPLYVVGEAFDLSHLRRVLLINGGTALAASGLLFLVNRGHTRLISALVVWSLLGLISFLAATSGEPIHTNVINFVLVLVLANLLLPGRSTVLVIIISVIAMSAIAYHQTMLADGPEANEKFVETVVQFVPQFMVIAVLLAMISKRAGRSP